MTRSRRIRAKAAEPSLRAAWSNVDGSSTIYDTDDPTFNTITLTVLNDTGAALTLTAGRPVPEGAPADGSALYMDFVGLLSDDCINQISWQASGWSFATFTSETSYLAAAPDENWIWAPGGELIFTLSGIVTSRSATSGNILLSFAGVAGLPPALSTCQIFVNVQNPPSGPQPLNAVITLSETDLIVADGSPQDLVLTISNSNSTPLGPLPWPEPPTFQLTFVYGDGAGALTTRGLGGDISVSILSGAGNVWKPVSLLDQGHQPYWRMEPDPNGGRPVLGVGVDASVSFLISGVIATLPEGVTLAYVSHRNIPGFGDGFTALEIIKVAPMRVDLRVVDSALQPNGLVAATLQFAVDNASYVSITNTSYAENTNGLPLIDTWPVSVAQDTVFTLQAVDRETGQHAYASVALVTPGIDTFVSAPATSSNWSGSTVTLSWTSHGIDGADAVIIYRSEPTGGRTLLTSGAASGSLTVTPLAPQTYVAELQAPRLPQVQTVVSMTPVSCNLSASPPGPYAAGDEITLTATITAASSYEIDRGVLLATTPSQMTTTVTRTVIMDERWGVNSPITFTLTAEGYGGTATSAVALELADTNARFFLFNGDKMLMGQYLIVGKNAFHLIMQTDGNLCLFAGPFPPQAACLWQSGTSFPPDDGSFLVTLTPPKGQFGVFMFDGNVAIFPNTMPIYADFGRINMDGTFGLYTGTPLAPTKCVWMRPPPVSG